MLCVDIQNHHWVNEIFIYIYIVGFDMCAINMLISLVLFPLQLLS